VVNGEDDGYGSEFAQIRYVPIRYVVSANNDSKGMPKPLWSFLQAEFLQIP
jgi:hypothetical protein